MSRKWKELLFNNSKIATLWHSDAWATYCTRVVGVIGLADEGQRMSVQHVTSLSKNVHLRFYILISFLQSKPGTNRSIAKLSAWFPILDRATVQYQYSKKGNVFLRLIARNMEQSPLWNILEPTNLKPLLYCLWTIPSGQTKIGRVCSAITLCPGYTSEADTCHLIW
jgi:hypothetical protein